MTTFDPTPVNANASGAGTSEAWGTELLSSGRVWNGTRAPLISFRNAKVYSALGRTPGSPQASRRLAPSMNAKAIMKGVKCYVYEKKKRPGGWPGRSS